MRWATTARRAIRSTSTGRSCSRATRAAASRYGCLYDTLSDATFDLGCEYDNYHGFYRYAEIDDGDLDYYVFAGPRIRDVVRKFTGADRAAWRFGRAGASATRTPR